MLNYFKKDLIKNLLFLILFFAIIFFSANYFDLSNLKDKIISYGIWGPIFLIIIKSITIIFAPLSGAALYPLAGAIFGFWFGFLYIFIGDAIGAIISFYLSRLIGQGIVEKVLLVRDIPTTKKIVDIMETNRGFLFIRCCFLMMPEIVSYIAGLTRIKFWKFFVIHNSVGIIPTAILVYGGHILLDKLNQPLILFGILFLIFIIAIIGGLLFLKYSRKSSDFK